MNSNSNGKTIYIATHSDSGYIDVVIGASATLDGAKLMAERSAHVKPDADNGWMQHGGDEWCFYTYNACTLTIRAFTLEGGNE